MSATTAGAYKAYLEGLGFGVSVYRDGAPRDRGGELDTSWPFAVITEGVGYDAERHGDTDDPDAHNGTIELVQVDLYQKARSMPDASGTTTVLERYDLPSNLDNALRSARGLRPHAPHHVYGVSVQGGQRWPISENIVRHTWTVRVSRDTRRRA